ncbi:MAG: hypothetical protein IJG69_08975 [Spirochaetales bacterium]|nr:hypothetical protein [Spirochaetales bacterium]
MSVNQCTPLRSLKAIIESIATMQMILKTDAQDLLRSAAKPRSTNSL